MGEWTDADLAVLASVLAARTMDLCCDPVLAELFDDLCGRYRGRRGGDVLAARQTRVAELARAGFSAPEICMRLGDVKLRTVESDLAALRDVLADRVAGRRRDGLRLVA